MIPTSAVGPTPARSHAVGIGAPHLGGGLVAILMVIALVATWSDAPADGFGFAIAASLLAHLVLLLAAYRAHGNAAHPLCLLAVHLTLMYPVHGLVSHDTIERIAVLGAEGDTWIVYALLVEITSLPMLWWGFHSAWLRRLSARLPRIGLRVRDGSRELRRKLALLYVAAWLARIPLLVGGFHIHLSGARAADAGDLGGALYVVKLVAELPLFVTWYLFAIGLTQRRRGIVLASLGLLAIELAWGLVSGSRMKVLWPLVGFVVAAATCWRPLRLPQLVAALALFVGLALPFSFAYREAYSSRLDEIQRDGLETSAIVSSLSDVLEGETGHDGASGFEAIAERLHGLTSLALVMRYTPERSDYLFGVSYLMAPLQIMVPRALWPDKPPLAPFVEVFRLQYWGIAAEDETSVAVSQLGDFWVNLHWPGVLAGSFVFGGIVAFLFSGLRCGTDGTSLLPRIVFTALVPQILSATEGAFAGLLVSLPKILLIYLLVAWFLASRRRHAVTPARSG